MKHVVMCIGALLVAALGFVGCGGGGGSEAAAPVFPDYVGTWTGVGAADSAEVTVVVVPITVRGYTYQRVASYRVDVPARGARPAYVLAWQHHVNNGPYNIEEGDHVPYWDGATSTTRWTAWCGFADRWTPAVRMGYTLYAPGGVTLTDRVVLGRKG